MLDFAGSLLSKIDIGPALMVLAVTEVVRAVLNVTMRKTYTDYLAPLIALVMGQLVAFNELHTHGLDPFLHGCELAGGSIAFSTVWRKALEGYSWVKNGMEDKVLAAKVECANTKAETQIEKMKALLKKNKE